MANILIALVVVVCLVEIAVIILCLVSIADHDRAIERMYAERDSHPSR
jgi:hypothetical protein